MSGSEPTTTDHGPWAWVWLDDSPHGETYAVRDAEGIVAYTSRTKAGYERAVRIADEHNARRELAVSDG